MEKALSKTVHEPQERSQPDAELHDVRNGSAHHILRLEVSVLEYYFED